MRILYCSFFFTTNEGSYSARGQHTASALATRGHDVTVLCVNHGRSNRNQSKDIQKYQAAGCEILSLPISYEQQFRKRYRVVAFCRYAVKVRQMMAKIDHDLVFATSTPITAGFPSTFFKSSRKRKPFVFESRDLWAHMMVEMKVAKSPWMGKALINAERRIYEAADHCIGLAPGIVDDMIDAGVPEDRAHLISNGADVHLMAPGDRRDLKLPGVRDKDFVAIFAGAHGVANGLSAILDVAGELKRRKEDYVKIVLIGEGAQKPKLVARAKEEGLDNCLFFDSVPKVELANIIGCANVGLMCLPDYKTFAYGTSPNKFFDHLAAGRPQVVNYYGWTADLVTENNCGIAVKPKDPGAMADAILRLRDDATLSCEMGHNARKLAESRFSWDILAPKFAETLELAASCH
jgi:glycosyltransferase involved in cell wall biosynthesis